jgi:hypothetical protein
MDAILYKQEDRLFYGKFPKNLDEVGRKLDLARGYEHAQWTVPSRHH